MAVAPYRSEPHRSSPERCRFPRCPRPTPESPVPQRPSPARCRAESSEAITRAPSHHAARSLCRSLEAIAGAPLRPEPQSPSRSAVTSQDLRRHHRSVVTPFAPTSTRAPPRYEISKDVTGASALSELRSHLPKRCRGTKHPKPSKNSCRAQSLEVNRSSVAPRATKLAVVSRDLRGHH
jgi:hypothetical protein